MAVPREKYCASLNLVAAANEAAIPGSGVGIAVTGAERRRQEYLHQVDQDAARTTRIRKQRMEQKAERVAQMDAILREAREVDGHADNKSAQQVVENMMDGRLSSSTIRCGTCYTRMVVDRNSICVSIPAQYKYSCPGCGRVSYRER